MAKYKILSPEIISIQWEFVIFYVTNIIFCYSGSALGWINFVSDHTAHKSHEICKLHEHIAHKSYEYTMLTMCDDELNWENVGKRFQTQIIWYRALFTSLIRLGVRTSNGLYSRIFVDWRILLIGEVAQWETYSLFFEKRSGWIWELRWWR